MNLVSRYLLISVLSSYFMNGSIAISMVKRQAPTFTNGNEVGIVGAHQITEASGLAASRKHPGILYTHNDHGNPSEIYAISSTGDLLATFDITGVTNNDWEDIALGVCAPGSRQYCIYVGDFGNSGHGAVNNVFRFREPDNLVDQTIVVSQTDKLMFTWSEPDAETLMVDPDGNTYVIAKGHAGHRTIAQLPISAWGAGSRESVTSSAQLNIDSSQNDPVGGDISLDGNAILIKTHEAIYYWDASRSHDYVALLQQPGDKVPYIHEHQGESVCWDATDSGYYTLSEGKNEPLYHYVRV